MFLFFLFLDYWTYLGILRLWFCLIFFDSLSPSSMYQGPFFHFASAVVIDKGRWKRIDCGLAGTGNAAK
jgi:hypothetical protein